MSIFKKIRKESQDFGIPWWKLPDFLMIVMALVNIFCMLITYWWLQSNEDPRLLVIMVALESILIIVIGNVVVESSKHLVAVNRLRKEFIDIMSHQMRTPTSIIRWYVELLLKNGRGILTDKLLGYINSIADANSKMISLVNDLLNLLNVDDKKKHFNFEKVDFIKVIEQTIKSQSLYAESRKISVVFSRGKSRLALVRVDPIKLKMALENILNNAIKYSHPNGQVQVTLKSSNKHWVCQIKDFGVGIMDEDKMFIFEKFYRTRDKRKLDIQGTGLGLYICQALVRGMDGDIWFKSKEMKSTEFFVKLPKS